MKKVQVFVGIAMITMIMSCGGFSRHIVKGTNSDTSQQRIVKTEEIGKNGDIDINIYDNDEQGRLTRVLETVQLPEMDLDKDGGSMLEYKDNEIVFLEKSILVDETYMPKSYKIENGLIVLDPDSTRFTYDVDGYLVKIIDKYGELSTEIKWEGSNTTMIGENEKFSYTDIPRPQNWFDLIIPLGLTPPLQQMGFWGKVPQNLPSEYAITRVEGSTSGFKYSYELNDKGQVVKMTMQLFNHYLDNKDEPRVITYVWE